MPLNLLAHLGRGDGEIIAPRSHSVGTCRPCTLLLLLIPFTLLPFTLLPLLPLLPFTLLPFTLLPLALLPFTLLPLVLIRR